MYVNLAPLLNVVIPVIVMTTLNIRIYRTMRSFTLPVGSSSFTSNSRFDIGPVAVWCPRNKGKYAVTRGFVVLCPKTTHLVGQIKQDE